MYWFQDSSTSPKRISPTSPEWCHPGEGFAELWGFAAAGAYEQRHTKHPRQRFDARDNLFSSYVQDVSWVGEILESSGGLFKIAWRNGTDTHQPPFNIEMCADKQMIAIQMIAIQMIAIQTIPWRATFL